jgi:hypothetical protein
MSGTLFRRSPRAIWRSSTSFLVAAVPPRPPTRVSGSAARVWDLLAEPITVDALVARLAETVAVPVTQLRTDVDALINQLVDLDLIEALS